MHKTPSLGCYLKKARLKAGLSPDETAARLGLRSPLNVLRWERNEIATLRLTTLRKLIRLYRLDVDVVFDLLLHLKLQRIELKLKKLEKKLCSV
jgi:transcriptional regulator with XRE-family HTH domain